jgi:hypothetical protein
MQLEYDKTTTLVMELGTALLRALSEHGLSKDGHNSFSFSELVGHKNAMLAGKAVRKFWQPFCLNFSSRLPLEFHDVHVQLSGGRLHLVRSVKSS